MAKREKKQQVANNTFQELKPDPESVLFSEEKIDERFLKKLKKYSYILTVGTIFYWGRYI